MSASLNTLLPPKEKAPVAPDWMEYGGDESEDAVKAYDKFWNFFVAKAVDMHRVGTSDHPLFQTLAEKLLEVDPKLCFEINKETGRNWSESELVISAEGQLNAFPKVVGLCKACPRKSLLDIGWSIQPFKQRQPIEADEALQMGTVELPFADVKFVAYPLDDDEGLGEDPKPQIALSVMVKEGTLSVSSHISDMVNIMIMAVIGEFESMTYISSIHYVDTIENEENVFNLSQLPQVLDSYLLDFQQKQARKAKARE